MKPRDISRRAFSKQLLSLGVASLFGETLLSACGKQMGTNQSQSFTEPPPNCLENGTLVYIQPVHVPNHLLSVPAADIVAGSERTYLLEANGSGHVHHVTLTEQDFLNLKQNNGVGEISTWNEDHTHQVRVGCAP